MDKCCPRVDVVSTHWEGCHTSHPECAAYRAGYEAGLRRAAGTLEMSNGEILLMAGELTAGELRAVRAVMSAKQRAILAQIKGE